MTDKAQQEAIPKEITDWIDAQDRDYPGSGHAIGWKKGAIAMYLHLRHKAEGEPAEHRMVKEIREITAKAIAGGPEACRKLLKDAGILEDDGEPAAEAAKEEGVIHFIAEQYGNAVAWSAMIRKLRDYASTKAEDREKEAMAYRCLISEIANGAYFVGDELQQEAQNLIQRYPLQTLK